MWGVPWPPILYFWKQPTEVYEWHNFDVSSCSSKKVRSISELKSIGSSCNLIAGVKVKERSLSILLHTWRDRSRCFGAQRPCRASRQRRPVKFQRFKYRIFDIQMSDTLSSIFGIEIKNRNRNRYRYRYRYRRWYRYRYISNIWIFGKVRIFDIRVLDIRTFEYSTHHTLGGVSATG